MEPHSSRGTYTGDASSQTIVIGYRPSKIVIWNETDGDARFEVIDGLAAAKAYAMLDTGSGATDLSVIASAAVTINDNGFSVGSDSDVNQSGKVFRYHVER